MPTLAITQVKSANGTNARQRATLESLGLRRIGHTVERPETPQLLGMVHAVRHLVTVQTHEETARSGSTGNAGAATTVRSGENG